MVTYEDMVAAWMLCRKNKRRTREAVCFEANAMQEIADLVDGINNRTYTIGTSTCFVVTRPRYREVFAANFRDRVPHHYVAMKLEPLFEQRLNDRTFNCRKGKGQLYGIERLKFDMWECSKGYTADCYIMKVDIKGFFMSIDKALMAREIDDFVAEYYGGADKEDIRWLCGLFIMHEPQRNCVRRSPAKLWAKLPAHKSLFTCPRGKGLPIGNLFTQLFANWHLTYLDEQIECDFGQFHGRYVDDIYVMSRDKQRLLNYVPVIRRLLADKGMGLNEAKFYIQHYSKGVEFTGTHIKPNRAHINLKVIDGLRGAVKQMNRVCDKATAIGYHFIGALNLAADSINSYLGMATRQNSYGRAREVIMGLHPAYYRYGYVDIRRMPARGSPIKVTLRKRFTTDGWADEQINILIKHKHGRQMDNHRRAGQCTDQEKRRVRGCLS